jgi:hypothetical protein
MDIHIYPSALQPELSAGKQLPFMLARPHSALNRRQHTQADAKLNAFSDFFTIQP